MSQTAALRERQVFTPAPEELWASPQESQFDGGSPFGLQGLTREPLTILKQGFIERLAVTLALRGTNEQIHDMEFVKRQLSFHPDWIEEYQVVHLIEKSLWIQGHSDLVMTMTKNPARVPDNPPEKVLSALSRAYALHPEATIWYGVPLFSDEKNLDGLPIPVTKSEIVEEARLRLEAAQKHALNWGWMYRSIAKTAMMPSMCWSATRRTYGWFSDTAGQFVSYWKRARRESRERARAAIIAELERVRFGCSQTIVPEHGTLLGRSIDTAAAVLEILEYQMSVIAYVAPFIGSAAMPLTIAAFIPKIIIPLTMVSVDPFLFVELPEEPGRLRHIGHWYWQKQSFGRQKLHLHA